jgi:hypothetical protein
MCDTCHVPDGEPMRRSRAAKLHAAVIALAVAGSLIAAVAGGSADQPPVTAGDRVFHADMARQAADASRIAAQAAGSPPLAELARRIGREDRRLGGRVPVSGVAAPDDRPPAGDRDLRSAVERHIAEDRLIARIALGSASSAGTRRAAAALLRTSRDWTARLPAPGPGQPISRPPPSS